MKKLIISMKPSGQVFDDFKRAFKLAEDGHLSDHCEISFDSKTDFIRFVENLDLLSFIRHFNPDSLVELSKMTGRSLESVSETITFFSDLGVVELASDNLLSVNLKPTVAFDSVEFNLAA